MVLGMAMNQRRLPRAAVPSLVTALADIAPLFDRLTESIWMDTSP